MFKKTLFAAVAFSAFCASGAVQFNWNFESPLQREDCQVLVSTVKNRHGIYTKILKTGVLPDGGNALEFSGKDVQPVAMPDIDFKETTIEIKFQLFEAPQQRMTLFTYQKTRFHWAAVDIYLDKRNTVAASFSVENKEKKQEVKIEVPNAQLVPGILHTLTVTAKSGGKMSVYLDGKLLKEEHNALSFSDLSPYVKIKYYPVGRLGYSVGSRYYRFFKGRIAGLKISDSIEIPRTTSDKNAKVLDPAVSRTDPNLVVNKLSSAPIIDGDINDPAWKNCEWTGKFIVMGGMSKTVNGLFIGADKKYIQNASDGMLGYHNGILYGAFAAPFPEGAVVKTEYKEPNPEAWRDDCIGFFLRVDETNRFYQIEFNSVGAWSAYECTRSGESKSWFPKTLRAAGKTAGNAFYIEFAIDLAEMGMKTPVDGAVWYGNITRRGASCGGLSTWAPVGEDFQFAFERFGKFIIGSRKAFLMRQLEKLAEQRHKFAPENENAAAEISRLREYIEKNGEEASNWLEISNRLQNVSNAIIQSINKGKSWFVWQKPYCAPVSPDESISIDSREVKEIKLKTAKGVRPVTMLLVSNLSKRNFMVNIQLIPYSKNEQEWLKNIRFREIAFIELNGGRFIPDPIFDLPLGSVFRVPAGNTGVLQIDINTKNLAPGKYRAKIRFVPSYSNFEYKEIALELLVSPVDLDKVKVRTWNYSLEPFMLKHLKDYEFNTICINYGYYGKRGQKIRDDGSLDFFKLEQLLEDFAANGIPKEDILLQLYPEYKWAKNFMSEDWQKSERKLYVDVFDFLKKKGLDEKNLMFSPTDEPNGNPDDPQSTAWKAFTGAKFIRSINPKFRLFINPWKVGDGYHKRYFEVFDVLCPFYPNMKDEKLKQAYRESGRDIYSYCIFSKSVAPERYRHRFWEHLDARFDGPATAYSMSHKSGDYFNSYDTNSPKSRINTDWSSTYISQNKDAVLTSRRLEAWYLGWVDFKLAKFCREKIEAAKKAGKNTALWQKEYDYIIGLGHAVNGDMEEASQLLLGLAEKLHAAEEK